MRIGATGEGVAPRGGGGGAVVRPCRRRRGSPRGWWRGRRWRRTRPSWRSCWCWLGEDEDDAVAVAGRHGSAAGGEPLVSSEVRSLPFCGDFVAAAAVAAGLVAGILSWTWGRPPEFLTG